MHLAPGGRVVVSALHQRHPPAGRRIAVGRLAGAAVRSDWRLETGDHLEIASISPPKVTYEHIFGPGDLEREAAAAGLHVVGRGSNHFEPFTVFAAD